MIIFVEIMVRRYIILIYMLTLWLAGVASQPDDAESVLARLDDAIAVRESYNHDRRQRIEAVNRDMRSEMADTTRYDATRALYRLYRPYRCDSAMLVAGERLNLARRIGDAKRLISASLNTAECYDLVGDPRAALAILDTLPRSDMEPYHFRYLYNIYGKAYRQLATAEVIPTKRIAMERRADEYTDSALSYFNDNDIAYFRLRAEKLSAGSRHAEALKLMLEAERRFGLNGANDCALTAGLYLKTGNADEAVGYMARAALIDIQEGVKTHGSLMKLAMILNDRGDFKRAYGYIRVALDDASDAQAQGLSREILQVLPLIDDAYAANEREIFRWRLTFGIAACVFAILLALALVFTHAQLRRVCRARLQLAEVNESLAEANEQKMRYLNEFFEAYSDAIEQRKELRKHFGRLLKSGQRSMALDVAATKSDDESSIADMYARFDAMFLSFNSGFADEYNSRVPERNAMPADALTSEGRVLALTRIGITSSKEIARLLHYSPQTVYNYRSRLKSWGFDA